MDKIGKYEVLRKIGAGGFASVYEGRDPYLKRRVAIKTCATDSEDIRQRFYREAEIAGNLEHRNIVTVFDFGFEDTVPYLVQEYLPGEDLDHRMGRREPFPTPRKLEILEQVAEGLAYAHAQGVIHRDIKPGNIRLLEDGRVKIMDFGIARLQSVETRLTKAGMTVGTAAYLSPEQVRGEPGGPQADVWAWGVLAYELLSGARPFEAAGMADLLTQVLEETPLPLAKVWKECPARLSELVARCLDKDPAKRYPGFGEVRADLAPLVRASTARQPVPSGPKEEVAMDAMDKTMRLSAEELQKLANEPQPPAAPATAEAASPDSNAVTAETAARPSPGPQAPPVPTVAPPPGESATRVLSAIDTAPVPGAAQPVATQPVVPEPAAPADPGRTSVLAAPPPPVKPAAKRPPAGPAPAAKPPTPSPVPPVPAAQPAANAAATARPAAPSRGGKKSPWPWILVGLGLVVILLAVVALFWFVVRPRLQARFATPPEVPVAEAPGAPAPAEAPASDVAPAPAASLTIAAPARLGTTVSIDGGPPLALAQALTLQVAPGEHLFTFAAPGTTEATVRLGLEAGAARAIEVPELAPSAPVAAPKKPRRRVVAAPAPEPPPAAPAPVVEEPPPPPPVQRGDLVEFGPGVVRPKLLRPLSADYPPAAQRLRAEARIGVAVLVDENGKVLQARVAEGDNRGLGFDEVALKAARAGAFQAATKNGVPVKMWHTVYLTFRSR